MDSNTTNCYAIDNTFSYYAGSCRGGFDFTLFFEQTILTALPVGIFMLATPGRIWYLLKRSKKTTTSLLLPLKVVRLHFLSVCNIHVVLQELTFFFPLSIGILRRTRRRATRSSDPMDTTSCETNKRIDSGPGSFVGINGRLLFIILLRTHAHCPSIIST